MSLLYIVIPSAVVLVVAYQLYGRLLARLLRLDPRAETPAVKFRDDVDYSPIEPKFLLSQHFSAIAAAGPIVGPILAGVMFGWLPALLWILIGSIFIGGVHDMTALVASIRHKAGSIAEVVREHMTRRSYLLFLAFIWIALVYIVVAFTDVTASSFVGMIDLTSGERVQGAAGAGGGADGENIVRGADIASSSLLYLGLTLAMGLLLRYTKLSLRWATIIFLPLVGVAIWAGRYVPFDVAALLGTDDVTAQKVWGVSLLLYCLVAGVLPMWLLLQPRGHLGGYFLYAALLGGGIGLLLSNKTIEYPAFNGWQGAVWKTPVADVNPDGWTLTGAAVIPFLFITIACGACSGFHSLIASGTTSKQLRNEADARPIGYGAMLLEAMVAILSLSCVMILARDHHVLQTSDPKSNYIYATGLASFLEVLGIPPRLAVTFGLLAFTTFVYDTLDVCTRLGRYILQELFGLRTRFGACVATALTAGVPLLFLLPRTSVPIWRVFWNLFGASNQLLAALTLLGVTVWLWRTRRARWVWLVTGVPTVLMYTMSVWALITMIVIELPRSGVSWAAAQEHGWRHVAWQIVAQPVPWVAIILVGLAALMLVEAIRVLWGTRTPPAAPSLEGLTPAGA
jgi:carbon starvation protein